MNVAAGSAVGVAVTGTGVGVSEGGIVVGVAVDANTVVLVAATVGEDVAVGGSVGRSVAVATFATCVSGAVEVGVAGLGQAASDKPMKITATVHLLLFHMMVLSRAETEAPRPGLHSVCHQ